MMSVTTNDAIAAVKLVVTAVVVAAAVTDGFP